MLEQVSTSRSSRTPPLHSLIIGFGNTHVLYVFHIGHGHTVKYLQSDKVTKYVPLEPNTNMHDEIRKRAAEHGYTEENGKLLILPYGAQETSLINSALGGDNAVDTIVAVLTICSIPSPKESCEALVNQVLKPGGTLVLWEHVLHPREDIAWWQKVWNPVWSTFFDGCYLDRPTHLWIDAMPVWAEKEVKGQEDDPQETLFPHRIGRFVKKA